MPSSILHQLIYRHSICKLPEGVSPSMSNILKKSLLLLLLISMTCIQSFAQGTSNSNIAIYADFQKGDSVSAAIDDLQKELNKSNSFRYVISPTKSYKGSGILILNIAGKNSNNIISVPAKMKSFGPEGIYIKGSSQSVVIAGNSNLALQEAIFLYLEQLGFRWLAPGEVWEVIPPNALPFKSMELLTQPSYEWRSIFNGHGFADRAAMEADYYTWARKSRMGGMFKMWLGHAYDDIVQRNASLFKEHPEYFSAAVAKGSIPVNPKFNVANDQLVQFIAKDAVVRFERVLQTDPSMKLLSMEPSDGGGFCETRECKAIGTPSDQVFYLANQAAKALRKKYPDAWVGSYAYNQHILPTRLPLEPNVFVMITNGFNSTKYNTYQLLDLWGKKAKKIGVYEYLSVYEWDFDLPGQMGAANTSFLTKSVKKYYEKGARAYIGESVMGWISKGWGQYLLSRLLWNPDTDVEALRSDYFNQAYGKAAPMLKKIYDDWENPGQPIPGDNSLAEWFRLLDQASSLASSDKISRRIDLVKMYLHYVVLYRNLKKSPSREKYIGMLQYAYRNFETGAFSTLPVMVSLASQAGPGLSYYDAGSTEWKGNKNASTRAEIQANFQDDMRSIKKVEGIQNFKASVAFVELGSVVDVTGKKYHTAPNTFWYPTSFIVSIKSKGAQNKLNIGHGSAVNPGIARPLTMEFFPVKNGWPSADEKPVLRLEQNQEGGDQDFSLADLPPGDYLLKVDDLRKQFLVSFSPSIKYSVVAGPNPPLRTTSAGGMNTFYFYVPKDVKKFIVHKSVVLNLASPSGRTIDMSNRKEESVEVKVESGEQGIWQINGQAGTVYIEGVPPYFGTHPARMLVPSYIKK